MFLQEATLRHLTPNERGAIHCECCPALAEWCTYDGQRQRYQCGTCVFVDARTALMACEDCGRATPESHELCAACADEVHTAVSHILDAYSVQRSTLPPSLAHDTISDALFAAGLIDGCPDVPPPPPSGVFLAADYARLIEVR